MSAPTPSHDPHLWLEDVTGEAALDWVHERNARAEQRLFTPEFHALKGRLRENFDAEGRIPQVVRRGEHLYNFWTDDQHPHGVWRRTTWASYRSPHPEWEVLLDLDALSVEEGITWVWHGAQLLRPQQEGASWRHALIDLSPGGSDADVTREFDLVTRSFVPESEGGFHRPESKGTLSWIDDQTVYLSHSLSGSETTSGYPRTAFRWRRGTPLEQAQEVLSVDSDDLSVGVGYSDTPGHERHTGRRALGFFSSETYVLDQQEWIRVQVPEDVRVSFHRDLILLNPRTDFSHRDQGFVAGSLIVGSAAEELRGQGERSVLFHPTETSSLTSVTATKNLIVLTIMEHVVERVEAYWREDGRWRSVAVLTGLTGSLTVAAVDAEENDELWVTCEDWLTPRTLHIADLSPVLSGEGEELEQLKQEPQLFDSTGLSVQQHFARSQDGTSVPYFLVGPEEVLQDPAGPPRPALLNGYGGFHVSSTPLYNHVVGTSWLEQGHLYAVANIRGGGEYGPQWHQAALRQNRHRAYEDFAAVARDLVDRGVTTQAQLACQGGSNGGLLTGNMLTQYPELFGAVVIQVPLLDMRRFAQLLAGASWRAEYGDPETSDWEFIRSFSPYHLLDPDADYPPVLLTTSTRDDRVHPGHARKMAAALEELGAGVTYWENTEGGHGGAANPDQKATMTSLMHTFLRETLGRGSGAAAESHGGEQSPGG